MLKFLNQAKREELQKITKLSKGGQGSGNIGHAGIPGHQGGSAPKGEEGGGSEEKSNYKFTAREKKYADNLSSFASEIAMEHGEAIKSSGLDQVVSDYYSIDPKLKVDADDLKNLTSYVYSYYKDNPKASYDDVKAFGVEKYREWAGSRAEGESKKQAEEKVADEKRAAARIEEIKANTPSKDEAFRVDKAGIDYEANRYTSDGPTGGGTFTNVHFKTAGEAIKAARYLEGKYKQTDSVNNRFYYEGSGARRGEARPKYYSVSLFHGLGEDEKKDTAGMQRILNDLKMKFGKATDSGDLAKGGPGSGRHAYGTGASTYFKERLGVNQMKQTEEELKSRLERKEAARKERWMPVFSKPKSIVIKTELGYRVVPKVEEK